MLIFIAALIIRLVVLYIISPPGIESDGIQYDEIAQSIVEGRGYALQNGTPTAFRPPVYPLFLAGIYSLLGNNVKIVQVIQALLLACVCIIVFYLGKIVFDFKVAYFAAGVAAVYPGLIYPCYDLWSEALLIFLFSLTILSVLKSMESKYYAIPAGILLSLSILTKPTVLFSLPIFIVWILKKQTTEERLKHISIFLAVFLICFIPWTIRNYFIFRSFIPMSSGGGIAFYDSHVLPDRGLGFSTKLPEELNSITDEVVKGRFLTRYTIEYMVHHPYKILAQTGLKMAMLFYPLDGYWYSFSFGSRYNVFWGTILLFSLAGVFSADRKAAELQLFLWIVLSFFITVFIFQGIPRYRLVLEPVFILFASFGFIHLYHHRRSWVIGILGFNIMLWFVFRYYDFHSLISWNNIKYLL